MDIFSKGCPGSLLQHFVLEYSKVYTCIGFLKQIFVYIYSIYCLNIEKNKLTHKYLFMSVHQKAVAESYYNNYCNLLYNF